MAWKYRAPGMSPTLDNWVHVHVADPNEVYHMTGNSTALRNGVMVARRGPPRVLLFLRQNHLWHRTRWCARRVFPVQDTSTPAGGRSLCHSLCEATQHPDGEQKAAKSKNTLPTVLKPPSSLPIIGMTFGMGLDTCSKRQVLGAATKHKCFVFFKVSDQHKKHA